jgi:D-3-phosphoglycerate dehydrogenase / 2-oxoglutarate reductase
VSAARFRVLIADSLSAAGLSPLTEDGAFELVEQGGLEGAALAAVLEECDAVIVRSATSITRESLPLSNRLRVIGRAGVGVDNIDLAAATERGIAVLNAPAGNTISAAELAFALLLAVVRRIPAADRSMKAGEWDRKSFNGVELFGKTLGLIGAGRIGGEVARRARAFGMRVIAHDPFITPERAAALELDAVELDEVITTADVISLHVPLTDRTQGMIGAAELRRMRRGCIIVNAARGGVLDEAALGDALESGHIAGAAMDVFAQEPLPADHRLRRLPNVVLTPHLGASTAEAQQNVALEITQAVRAALLFSDFSCAVNAPAIGGEEMRRLAPLLDLTTRLGRLARALIDGGIVRVDVRYAGPYDEATRPLAVAAVVGLLEREAGRGNVNLVNAMHLAESRGMEVERTRAASSGDYAEYIELHVTTADGATLAVAGAQLAEGHPRIVRIGDFRVSVRSRGLLLVLRNRDVPGVIGSVGGVLGATGLNIAEYHQARLTQGGDALAAISIDAQAGDAALDALRELPEVLDVRQALLDP